MSNARTSLLSTLALVLGAASAIGWTCGDDKPAAAPSADPAAAASAAPSASGGKNPDEAKPGANGMPGFGTYYNPAPPATVIGSATPPPADAPGFKTARVAVFGGTITTSEEISFKPGTSELSPGVSALLDEVALTIRNHPELKRIRIEGHCAIAREGQWQLTNSQLEELSKDRAGYVKSWLVARGVDEKMLASEGFGTSQPLVPNDSLSGQAKNRRVAFVIMEKNDPAKPDKK